MVGSGCRTSCGIFILLGSCWLQVTRRQSSVNSRRCRSTVRSALALPRASALQRILRALGEHSTRRQTSKKRVLPRRPGEPRGRSPHRGAAPDREAPLSSRRPKARAERAGVGAAGVEGAEQACMRARRSFRSPAAGARFRVGADSLRPARQGQLAARPLLGEKRKGEHGCHSGTGFPCGASLAQCPQESTRVRRYGQAGVAMSRAMSPAKAPVRFKLVQAGART